MIAPLIFALWLPPARAGLLTETRRLYAKCAGKLSPLTRKNAGQAVTLRTGERVPLRYTADVVRLSLEVLLKNGGQSAAEDLARLARNSAHAVPADAQRLLRRHRLLRPDGRIPAEIEKVLRASAKFDGDHVTIVSPAALPALTDAELREYFERVDRHVVSGLVELAKARGLAVSASTDAPLVDDLRTPRDGTLLVDLGAGESPVTLITPFGRLAVFASAEAGTSAAWTAFKAEARVGLGLMPIDLGPASSSDLHAALSAFGHAKFRLPDEGLQSPALARATVVESWNALKPSARASLDQDN